MTQPLVDEPSQIESNNSTMEFNTENIESNSTIESSENNDKCKNDNQINLKKIEEKNDLNNDNKSTSENNTSNISAFECNICFDAPEQPVVTSCGHLYCWGCIYRWINSGRSIISCPVCKADINKSTIIPIYGRGGNESDPRNTIPKDDNEDIPPRPTPERTETMHNPRPFNPFGFTHHTHYRGNGITFSAGIGPGIFPFQMNAGPRGQPLTPEQQQDVQRSRLLLLLAFIILATTILLS